MNSYQIKRYYKLALLVFAFAIGFISLWYTNRLVNNLAEEERQKARIWADATERLASTSCTEDIDFLLSVVQANTTIPVILTDEENVVINHRNVDSSIVESDQKMRELIAEMADENPPIIVNYVDDESIKIYYRHSTILTKLSIYPFFQLGVIGLFLLVSYLAFSSSRRSEQNQVWVGMSKETAHQLGTPISSLMAWVDLIKESPDTPMDEILPEMEKDLGRLQLITERFSKIGSEPDRKEIPVGPVLENTINYLRTRSSSRVDFDIQIASSDIKASINEPLFAWVIENLTKNAIDAMTGQGKITYTVFETDSAVYIDVADTGKGIPSSDVKNIFKPGFTTKKRGWGLGLSLVKRIVENYHHGVIHVKESNSQGTTFRIQIKK
jgi:nitrogen-specific signal transduction histidine kinase